MVLQENPPGRKTSFPVQLPDVIPYGMGYDKFQRLLFSWAFTWIKPSKCISEEGFIVN